MEDDGPPPPPKKLSDYSNLWSQKIKTMANMGSSSKRAVDDDEAAKEAFTASKKPRASLNKGKGKAKARMSSDDDDAGTVSRTSVSRLSKVLKKNITLMDNCLESS